MFMAIIFDVPKDSPSSSAVKMQEGFIFHAVPKPPDREKLGPDWFATNVSVEGTAGFWNNFPLYNVQLEAHLPYPDVLSKSLSAVCEDWYNSTGEAH